jgi:hypothetical protein
MKDIIHLPICDKFILFVFSANKNSVPDWLKLISAFWIGSRRLFQPHFYLTIPQLLQNEIYLLTMSCVLKKFPEMFVSDAKAKGPAR